MCCYVLCTLLRYECSASSYSFVADIFGTALAAGGRHVNAWNVQAHHQHSHPALKRLMYASYHGIQDICLPDIELTGVEAFDMVKAEPGMCQWAQDYMCCYIVQTSSCNATECVHCVCTRLGH